MKRNRNKIYIIITLTVAVILAIFIYLIMKNNNSANIDNFSCPTTDYIDCMPRVGISAKDKADAEKQTRYCDFVAKNCPNVIIAE